MTYVPSVMEFPHHVYLIIKNGSQYVGITASLASRMKTHGPHTFVTSFMVPTRREAEGVEATLHQLQKTVDDIEPYMDAAFYMAHSLWFNRSCKGYPKHLTQKPQLRLEEWPY